MNVSYAPTATMRHPAADTSGRHHALTARPPSRRVNRLSSPNINPNNGRHARWCSCIPGYVCEDHRLRY